MGRGRLAIAREECLDLVGDDVGIAHPHHLSQEDGKLRRLLGKGGRRRGSRPRAGRLWSGNNVGPSACQTPRRKRAFSARRALLRHPWASRVLESRGEPAPTVIAYLDSMMGIFLAGGFSIDLMHHAMHVMGSRILGFSQELFDDTSSMPADEAAEMWTQLADVYPNIAKLIPVAVGTHDEGGSVVGGGCDDQFEFEFALDLILDGLERLRTRQSEEQQPNDAQMAIPPGYGLGTGANERLSSDYWDKFAHIRGCRMKARRHEFSAGGHRASDWETLLRERSEAGPVHQALVGLHRTRFLWTPD